MQLGEVQCRTGLDIQLQLERNPLFPGHNRHRRIVLDVDAAGRREREVEIDLGAFAKRPLAAGRAQDADDERRSPLPIVLDQDRGRLRETKLQRLAAGQSEISAGARRR